MSIVFYIQTYALVHHIFILLFIYLFFLCLSLVSFQWLVKNKRKKEFMCMRLVSVSYRIASHRIACLLLFWYYKFFFLHRFRFSFFFLLQTFDLCYLPLGDQLFMSFSFILFFSNVHYLCLFSLSFCFVG